jgi:hypothetical protein
MTDPRLRDGVNSIHNNKASGLAVMDHQNGKSPPVSSKSETTATSGRSRLSTKRLSQQKRVHQQGAVATISAQNLTT